MADPFPKGPSRTKYTTESEFRCGEKIRYGRSKRYGDGSEMLSTEGSFGY